MSKGTILKMDNELIDGTAHYELTLGQDVVKMNELVGKTVHISYTGNQFCIHTGEKIKKSYGQGYSYKAFITLPECDMCIVKPELCHFAKGTCRDAEWGKAHCLQPHYVYLANTGAVKVGITRAVNIPHRWIDQGASFALPILKVKDRLTSGLIETALSEVYSDKTNWRKMLSGPASEIDLDFFKQEIYENFESLIDQYDAEDLDDDLIYINYPVLEYPSKINSLNFDKNPVIQDRLLGIKGQYLIFPSGVINLRSYQGYEICLEIN